MESRFSEATGTPLTGTTVVDLRSGKRRAVVDEELPPLSMCERWSLGFALLVASVVVAVAERLPRRNQFLKSDPRSTGISEAAVPRLVLIDCGRPALRREPIVAATPNDLLIS